MPRFVSYNQAVSAGTNTTHYTQCIGSTLQAFSTPHHKYTFLATECFHRRVCARYKADCLLPSPSSTQLPGLSWPSMLSVADPSRWVMKTRVCACATRSCCG